MSAQAPGASWQREELAARYVGRREALLPMIDVQNDLLVKLFARADRPIGVLLDVGSGDGAMSELLLGAGLAREAVLLDSSRPMLDGADRRLGRFEARWRRVVADLSDPRWRQELPHRSYGGVVSGYAIHHLPAERKRALFAEIHELLEPGGMFVNADYVSIEGPLQGLFDEHWEANVVRHEHMHENMRNEAADLEDDDDRPDPLHAQLQWLQEAGFAQVEVHFKWAEAAIFGAAKPSERS